ncbi:MAG: sn-glycerol-3-phosphate ABC transporter ATP-binding protein UgpC [Clostridia bacterium]|nr:sn-glycerol-3-phosphate ABC transporter ATP-binding protein UgpC [Clostridia bacterium]
MSSLNLKGIYKVYPSGVVAVTDFNLDIEDKEFIVFVGPSGCGKSTTLRMIAGLEAISAGELYIDGLLVNDIAPKDRDIAMVFQNYALYPHMTVYDNMAFGLKLRKMPKAEIDARVREAARILGIEMYLSRKPSALSGGQRQRVALGRAIVREPKVFLLDEPLSNLDAKLRAQMRTEITKLHDRLATTFIYVTHDQVEAMTMGTRIVVMKDGFMQQVDEPLNLYDYPINQFVAGFIGTPQMNFFDAVLTGTKNKVYVEFGEDKVLLPKEKVALICNLDEYLNTGKPVIFGIRPENIKADPAVISANKESVISVNVEFIEGLGAETLLYCKTKDIIESDDIIEVKSNLTAKVENRTFAKAGDTIELALDLSRCHLFDKETEITIVARTEDGKAELEAMQAARVEEERIKAEERAAKEAEEAAKLAAKLEKKNAMLKKFGFAKKSAPAEEVVEEVVEEPKDEE